MTLIESEEDLEQVEPSEFGNFYFEFLMMIKNMPMHSKTYFVSYVTVVLIVLIIISILRLITEWREGQSTNGNAKAIFQNRSFTIDELIHFDGKALEKLHQACDKCYNRRYFMECIKLVSHCPHLINKSHPNSKGITPFHRVCYRGDYALIEFMIDKGANLSQETESGENAFHMAIDYYFRNPSQKDFKCLDFLYGKGCFVKEDDKLYKQFVSKARESENENLLQWLTSHMTPISK